ncbi:hypothetical protein BHM03_00054458 [Ensete ventricosum]|nr:hypothetical protein BHM03_00054458 [Ensete ventricosum]
MPWPRWRENGCRGHDTYQTYKSFMYKCKQLSRREFVFIYKSLSTCLGRGSKRHMET